METIFQSIEILSKEKGIDPQIVLDAVKDAMLIAARKHFRTNEDYDADLDHKTGAIQLFAVRKPSRAVEDPGHEMTLAEARRIDPAAEIGTEIRIRQEHRRAGPHLRADRQAGDFSESARSRARNHLSTNTPAAPANWSTAPSSASKVRIYVLDLGKTEARLPKNEQSRLESYSVGDRVRCVIKLVDKSAKGPGVVVSRAAPELVKRLFEQEVPEIYDGTVTIRGCAREAGERTKIAVSEPRPRCG